MLITQLLHCEPSIAERGGGAAPLLPSCWVCGQAEEGAPGLGDCPEGPGPALGTLIRGEATQGAWSRLALPSLGGADENCGPGLFPTGPCSKGFFLLGSPFCARLG